jgi:hypothetical protein
MNFQISKGERGVALLIAMFALLLLSVIGLGMMYSNNMETLINSNYRDKQGAFYSALAGLQEARQRIVYPYSINPSDPTVTPPMQLPSTTAANIIYFIADSTVAPWSTSNKYLDTELCQERLSLTGMSSGTTGIPCTTLPSVSNWYASYNDSASTSAPWNLSYPLDLKWVRVQLKANNNTPHPVNGNASDGSQTCWDGYKQMSTPYGTSTGCQPVGGVTVITIVTSGSGYTVAPTVTFVGGSGSGATATANIAHELTGDVASISLTSGGIGYTSPPVVTITGLGSGATATAALSSSGNTTDTGGIVQSISLATGGTGYTSAPTVTIGGPGTGATAVAVLSSSGTTVTSGYVSTITLTTGGAAYTSAPTINITGGGGGSGATAVANLAATGSVTSVTVGSIGTQCFHQASDVQIAFSGGGGTGATASAILESTPSCAFSVSVPGPTPNCSSALSVRNQANVTFSSNTTASGTLSVGTNYKSPTGFSLQNPGTGFTGTTPWTSTLTMSSGSWTGGDCSNVVATITDGYHISSINVTNGGSGYSTPPSITITGGAGSTSQPSATAGLAYYVASVTVTNGGSGYTQSPNVHFSGGGGSGAVATANVITTSTTTYPVAYISVTNGGNGYLSAPTVALSGGSGAGALATANIRLTTLTTYSVASITVNNAGTGYSVPPAITLSGGGGSGASAIATLGTTTLSTYYVSSITVNNQGSGYTSNPTVVLSGGGYTTIAAASSQVSGGTKYGNVWLLTSFAQTKTGARSMLQMETANAIVGFALGGALTLDGPNPAIDAMPNSNNFKVSGNDANSCGQTAEAPKPAIDGYDDPNASPPTNSVSDITNALPRPDHYIGSGGTPSVQNGYAALGDTMGTPLGLQGLMGAIYNAPGAVHYNSSNVGSFSPSSTTLTSITYVDGDLSTGPTTGNGILVVTGTLTMSGNFGWNGLIFVVGKGNVQNSGGGNGQINGSLFVANIYDSSGNLLPNMGQPTFHWNGGGGNGVYYDHCLAENLMTAVPLSTLGSTRPPKTLSFRILPY